MNCVLIKLSGGIVDTVTFYDNGHMALQGLADFVRGMDPHDDDAALYTRDGLIANAKDLLDETGRFTADAVHEIPVMKETDEPVFIIGNPNHHLGFMVASADDPLGYSDPLEGLSDLGQMRKDYGTHLKLYRAIPVTGFVAGKKDLEKYNTDCDIEDFDYTLIEEYMN